jgi:pimeloyl-ACP methyl ester carboxylesterase
VIKVEGRSDIVTSPMIHPSGLNLIVQPAASPEAPTVIFVHGSLDRAESFRRVMRRLPDLDVVAYDRRGYQRSRAAGVVDVGGHIADLVELVTELRARSSGRICAIGHSLGGVVVVGAALSGPRVFDSIGAFEPPMPWLGFRPVQPGETKPKGWAPLAEDPGEEAERFFCRMMSPTAWQRLTDEGRADRRADGPALVADLRSMRGDKPFEVTDLSIPAVFGMGGPRSHPHHRQSVIWLGAHVPGAMDYEIEGAQHGAHLSHPDHFAAFTRTVVERAAL